MKMNLRDLTREYIKRFAGPVMLDRGQGYYRSGLVTDLEYDEDAATITADVEGNYGNYYVQISEEGGRIRANCELPIRNFVPCRTSSGISDL